jgi:hypothetical protein
MSIGGATMGCVVRWRRPYRDSRVLVGHPLLVIVVAVWIMALASLDRSPVSVAFGLAISAGVVGYWRLLRIGLYVSRVGVRAQGLFRSTTIAWSDLAPVRRGLMVGDHVVLSTMAGNQVWTYLMCGWVDKVSVVISPKRLDRVLLNLEQMRVEALS